MRVVTSGVVVTVAQLRETGKKMKRNAYGQAKALVAYEALRAAGAVVQGTITYGSAGRYVNGVTGDNRAFVYEEEGSFASSLYVETVLA